MVIPTLIVLIVFILLRAYRAENIDY